MAVFLRRWRTFPTDQPGLGGADQGPRSLAHPLAVEIRERRHREPDAIAWTTDAACKRAPPLSANRIANELAGTARHWIGKDAKAVLASC
jgi:hypothetical protein